MGLVVVTFLVGELREYSSDNKAKDLGRLRQFWHHEARVHGIIRVVALTLAVLLKWQAQWQKAVCGSAISKKLDPERIVEMTTGW